jgi:hypothetical protein
MPTRIQVRRDTTTAWANTNPVLAIGEPAVDVDTGDLRIGNGSTRYLDLPIYAVVTWDAANGRYKLGGNVSPVPAIDPATNLPLGPVRDAWADFFRRARTNTTAGWAASNPVLPAGAIAFDTNTREIRIGDGVTAYLALPVVNNVGVSEVDFAKVSPATEVPYYAYGDSFVVGSGATATGRGFANLLPTRLRSVSPTNAGVSGTQMAQTLGDVMTLITANRRGLHVLNSGINSIINVAASDDAAEKIGFQVALKGCLRVLRGTWLPGTDASIAYTGTWTAKTTVKTRTGNPKFSSVSGDKVTVTTTAAEISLMLLGFSPTSVGGGPFSVTVNGSAYTTEYSSTQASTSPVYQWSPLPVRIVNPSPGTTMTVVVTKGTGDLYFDGYVVKADSPAPVLVGRIVVPPQAGLNVNGASSNRTPENVAVFNGLIDAICSSAEFAADGLVKVVDPSPFFDNASMRAADSLHPNNIGHKVIAYAFERAARALPTSVGLNL